MTKRGKIKRSSIKSTDRGLRKTIRDLTQALEGHWVYDAVQLFNDCAVALNRMHSVLDDLEARADRLADREQDISNELEKLRRFFGKWDIEAGLHLDSLVCPNEVEFRLEELLNVGCDVHRPDAFELKVAVFAH